MEEENRKRSPQPRDVTGEYPGWYIISKVAWRQGRISFLDYLRRRANSGREVVEERLYRWARRKKAFDGVQLNAFIEELLHRTPFGFTSMVCRWTYSYEDKFEYCPDGCKDEDYGRICADVTRKTVCLE